MYRPLGAHQKDVSTRLMKPTCPDIKIKNVLHLVKNWNPAWEFDGDITVFDAGIAQYLLVDERSHDIFFASLILGKPSLRCKLINNEPKDVLDEEANNTFRLVDGNEVPEEERKKIDYLKTVLGRKGYQFTDN
ncbi:putative polyketide synthase [Dirofilaria immitis]